ncbi:MAG: Mth938-like domain-containing protein [Candidatus Bipolaricaulis sp.]|jgi:hypothetical protein
MRLANYHFGRIEADGVVYTHDLVVTPTEIRDWRRREGHRVYPEDLEPALAATPQTIVIGTGFSGLLQVTTDAMRVLKGRAVELVAEKTAEAVEAFNDLSRSQRVCALLHLTC